jgi:hypothetical protein
MTPLNPDSLATFLTQIHPANSSYTSRTVRGGSIYATEISPDVNHTIYRLCPSQASSADGQDAPVSSPFLNSGASSDAVAVTESEQSVD